MKGLIKRAGVFVVLVMATFYTLYGEVSIPDLALESVKLLKKPIEELLPDLKDEEEPETVEAIQKASLDLEPYRDLYNKRERWNEMRQLIETGQPLVGPLPSEVVISTSPRGRLAPAAIPPPNIFVDLPYESRLTVSGRKTIGMTYRSTNFTNSSYATTQGLPTGQSNFELQQQLQVRINGQIGRKVTINVDFDDTKEDKKDISIVYKGDPEEIVQRAAFGDITLSLPQTEFAGYSKQVFGASAELKYKALKGYFIGSRTKGETETKEFVGNVILQRVNVADTAYIRQRYYNYTRLTGGANDKPVNINTLEVYINTKDTTRQGPQYITMDVDQSLISNRPGSAPDTVSGLFEKLKSGVDYTVDPSSGVITFRNRLANPTVIAIDYQIPNGVGRLRDRGTYPGQPKVIKWDESLVTIIPDTEELTRYSVGVQKIVRDNNQGNFTLQLRDLGNNPIGQSLGVIYLPNNAGVIQMDFENGTFALSRRLDVTESKYASVYTPTPVSQSTFFLEFRSRVKTYVLRPNIVIGSEQITINGRRLQRDVDYFLDYESGFLTFFNEDQITEDSRIRATYDFSPFGIAGAQQDTLVGTRAELSLYPLHPILGQSLIGSTVIYDFAPKQTSPPDIRQTSGSFLVSEADVHFKDLIFNPLPFLKSSFSMEVAQSNRNPNTFGKALIENMEGIKDETSVSLSKLSWSIAANPTTNGSTYATALGIVSSGNNPGDNLTNDRVRTLDINPQASALPGDQMQVLNVRYDLSQSPEASIATVLSRNGIDFSKKLFVEMWIQGDGTAASTPSGTEMNVTLGQISEDSDNTGGGGFVDDRAAHALGDRTPRTEDLNYNNTLDANEDIGWEYINPDNTRTRIGISNLALDSQDFDRNGIMDFDNSSVGGSIGYAPGAISPITDFQAGATPGSAANTIDHTGWKFARIPLNISSDTLSASRWSAIKQLRISLRPGAGPKTGLIRIAKIAIVGNRWLAEPVEIGGSTVTVKAINNEDDANYVSPAGNPDFDSLNQVNTALSGPTPNKKREQALAINYVLPGVEGSSVAATAVTTSPMDFTVYGQIRMFVYGDGSGNGFFYRVGTDTDYLEFSSSMTWTGWRQIYIDQIAPSRGQRPTGWAANGSNPGPSWISVRGNPNLSNVARQTVGVRKAATGASTGEIWVNEIYAADVLTRTGYAAKLGSDFEIFGWGSFGLTVRDIDRNFETFTSAIANQDRHESNAYLNFTRLSWFPMKFTGGKQRTVTPAINTVTGDTLVSILQEGRVDRSNFSANGTLQVPRWPRLGMTYDTDDTKTAELYRKDSNDRYGATLDYTVPLNKAYLPKTIALGYKISKLNLDFGPQALLNTSDPFSVSDTRNETKEMSAKMSFQPLNGFTFNPNYSLMTTREEKDVLFSTTTVEGSTVTLSYDKAKSQTAGFDGVLTLQKWLAPRVRYSITTRETYGIPLASDPGASLLKTVDRQSTGESAWDFAWRDLQYGFAKKSRALQSFNAVTSFTVEDGDSWDKVDAGYNSLSNLSIRTALKNGERRQLTARTTLRSTQRWSPFDWVNWKGAMQPWRTLSITSTYTGTRQRSETTGTESRVLTTILPDLIFSLSQTEHFFRAQNFMSNSQMNVKAQYKKVDTVGTSLQKSSTNGGDWRFTMWRKLDLFFTYTRTADQTQDRINNVTSSKSKGETLGAQAGMNIGKWRITPKYDQTKQETQDSSGRKTADLTTRTPAIQLYADLYLPAGLRLPFGDLMVFSNRIRTTNTFSLTQRRSSLNTLNDNTDTYAFTTSNDYEITPNIRLTVGGGYTYTNNKTSADANIYSYEFNSLLTIQF